MHDVTDLFAGAGGSSTGMIDVPGVTIKIAANHWQMAIDVHNANHPETDHACADIHKADPRYFPTTEILWASPECTKWSQANSKQAEDPGLFPELAEEASLRSRMLMFDVPRFMEYHRYKIVIVENVVEIAMLAKYRHAWMTWQEEIRKLDYEFRVVSLNSMHAQYGGPPAPQSRDRLYVVCWPRGNRAPDIDKVMRPAAYCPKCATIVESRQSWKNGRSVGRYRAQYVYVCAGCATTVEPGWLPAAAAIDWKIPGQRIGDRKTKLADKTRARIAAGIARYWRPLTLEAAGNTFERRPGVRAWPMDEPLRTLHCSESKALAVPLRTHGTAEPTDEPFKTFVAGNVGQALAVPVEGRENGTRARSTDEPLRGLTTRAETALAELPFVTSLRGGHTTDNSVTEPAGTFTAGGNHHGLVTSHRFEYRTQDADVDPVPTLTASGNHVGLVTPAGGSWNDDARPTEAALRSYTTREAYALVTRQNGIEGGHPARHTTPAWEVFRTLTANGSQTLLMPYYSGSEAASPADRPVGTLTTRDRYALVHRHNTTRDPDSPEMTTPDWEVLRTLTTAGHQSIITPGDLEAAEAMVDDCLFRMFQPHEVAAGQAFPSTYRWDIRDTKGRLPSNRNLVKMAGNAVTPPSARDLMYAAIESLEGAA